MNLTQERFITGQNMEHKCIALHGQEHLNRAKGAMTTVTNIIESKHK